MSQNSEANDKVDSSLSADTVAMKKDLLERYELLKAALDWCGDNLHIKSIGAEPKAAASMIEADAEVLALIDKIGASDAFVEKAIFNLRKQARWSFFAGVFCWILCGLLLAYIVQQYSPSVDGDNIELWKNFDGHPFAFSLQLVRKLFFSAIFLASIYFLSSLARAFLAEWSVLYHRQHAVRLGRLAVYLYDANITPDRLLDLFGWNIAQDTPFNRIKTDLVTKGLMGQMGDLMAKITEATANLLSATRK